jgi:hypothetical protein
MTHLNWPLRPMTHLKLASETSVAQLKLASKTNAAHLNLASETDGLF